MTLNDLIAQFRRDADDTQEPYLWSNDDLRNWLNEAEREAAIRAKLLRDSSTAALTLIVAAAGDPWIPIDPRVWQIERARPTGLYPVPLRLASDMDAAYPLWEDATGTELRALITDLESSKLRTYPILSADLEINLTVIRYPLQSIVASTDTPELHERHHLNLLHWVGYRAYSRDDVDAFDPKQAMKHLGAFEHEFGRRNTAGDVWLFEHGGQNLTGDPIA